MSFGLLRELLGFNKPTEKECLGDCITCPAAPASVTPHSYHVLLRLTPPAEAAGDETADHWWPEKVDG